MNKNSGNTTIWIVVVIVIMIIGGWWTYAKYSNSSTGNATCTDPEIKGNLSSTGEKIFHVPGQRYYNKTEIDVSAGERWFCTEEEAEDAGWRRSKI